MQKLKSTLERKTKRHHPILTDTIKTDQSYKKSCDINNIVKQFSKTGILPNSTKIPQYGDFSEAPTLEAAFDVAHAASKAFQSLPSDIRKLLGNDPSQLENFIANEDNKEICLKYGLTVKAKEIIIKPDASSNPITDTTKIEVKNEQINEGNIAGKGVNNPPTS